MSMKPVNSYLIVRENSMLLITFVFAPIVLGTLAFVLLDSLKQFDNIVPVIILASINALISSSQATYIIRLDSLIQDRRARIDLQKNDNFSKFAWVWTLLVAAFFAISVAALLSVTRIILTYCSGINSDQLFKVWDTLIIISTGWGYLLLFSVAVKSWILPSSLNRLVKKLEEERPENNKITISDAELESIKKRTENSSYYKLLGLHISNLTKKGKASICIEVDPDKHYHLYKQMHGGVALSIADSAGGAALAPLLDKGKRVATVNLSLNFQYPAIKGKVVANAKVVGLNKKTGIVEVSVLDEEKNVVCTGEVTYAILALNDH